MAEKAVVLMLKDYLELDSHCSDYSFQCSTMRYLLDTELNHANLSKPNSKSPVSKLTTLKQAFSGSRSLSKRLMRSLAGWKRPAGDEKKKNTEAMAHKKDFKLKDIMRLSSFNNGGEGPLVLINSSSPECPSPIVSSCSSAGSTSGRSSISRSSSSSGSEFLISSVEQVSPPATVGAGARDNNMGLEKKEMEKQECCFHSLEDESEKEQLSPVSVMDFPYDQDEEQEEEESTSHDFQQSLANIERSKHQLLQKIRRFECIAELEPIALDRLFEEDEQDANEDNEVFTRALELVKQLKEDISFITTNDNIEKILLDFFIEGIWSMRNDVISGDDRYAKKEQLLLNEGINWLNQVEYSVREDDLSVAYLKEMEKNGRWRCFDDDDETEVAMDLELDVMESLLDELVLDLLA